MNPFEKTAVSLGRILLALIFLITGIGKITGYAGTQGYMESVGVPGALLPLVILLEVGGGLALILGFKTRMVALSLAAFSVGAALLFHLNFADPAQFVSFWKNFALAGGFLILAAHGAGPWSLDRLSGRS